MPTGVRGCATASDHLDALRRRCAGGGSGDPLNVAWNEDRDGGASLPASVVKLVYAVAVEQWLQRDLIPDSDELQRALRDMIADSSNDATGSVVDLLSGTTSGPELCMASAGSLDASSVGW